MESEKSDTMTYTVKKNDCWYTEGIRRYNMNFVLFRKKNTVKTAVDLLVWTASVKHSQSAYIVARNYSKNHLFT